MYEQRREGEGERGEKGWRRGREREREEWLTDFHVLCICLQKIITVRPIPVPGSAPKPRPPAPKPTLHRIKKKKGSDEEDAPVSFSSSEGENEASDDDLFGEKEGGRDEEDSSYKPSSSIARSEKKKPARPAKKQKSGASPVRPGVAAVVSSDTDSESPAEISAQRPRNPLASDPHAHPHPAINQSPVKKKPVPASSSPVLSSPPPSSAVAPVASSAQSAQLKKPGPPKQTGSVKQRLAKKLGVKMGKK